jgi:hypothetical protein
LADLQLQPSINDARSQAHLALINRLKALDLSPILVYRIASLVDSAVLPMAWQWDVLNPLLLPELSEIITLDYPAWDPVTGIDTLINLDTLEYQPQDTAPASPQQNYEQYRLLILLSTALHRVMGTVGGLKRALAGLGYPNAVVQEGQNTWGGTTWPSNEGWAVFRVLIDLATVPAGTDLTTLVPRIYAICNFWKPARCWLDSVQFGLFIADTLIPPVTDRLTNIFTQHDFLIPHPTDLFSGKLFPIADKKTLVPYWNDRYYHAGITYGQNEPEVADSAMVRNGVPIAH